MRTALLALLLAGTLVAGCFGRGPTTSRTGTTGPEGATSGSTSPGGGSSRSATSTGSPTVSVTLPSVDGQAAWDLARDLVQGPGGVGPRPRVPGTQGHEDAALELSRAMQVQGWTVHWQNFTGADYEGMPKGSVEGDYTNPYECTAADKAELPAMKFHNLVATRPASVGSNPTDKTMALGAHWEAKRRASHDSQEALRNDPVPAANDGASGVGILLQLMRHVEAISVNLPFNLTVVLLDGEDGYEDCHPLAGSIAYTQSLRPGEVDRFLLLDMVGDRNAAFVRETASVRCDPRMVELLWQYGKAAGIGSAFPAIGSGVSDDHIPFVEAHIPAVDLIDLGRGWEHGALGFPPYWHTTADTMDKLDPPFMGHVADVVLSALADPRFHDAWPGSC